MLETLSDRPGIERLREFVRELVARYGDRVAFVVLFGSMARGDWSAGSDYDVLVGLEGQEGKRFDERFEEIGRFAPPGIEPFVYTPPECRRMLEEGHLTLFGALSDGIVLRDQGEWSRLTADFRRRVEEGRIVREDRGWRIV